MFPLNSCHFKDDNKSSSGIKIASCTKYVFFFRSILNGWITNLIIPCGVLMVGGSRNSGVTIWQPRMDTDTGCKDSEVCVAGCRK
jgi:hypothetical protein